MSKAYKVDMKIDVSKLTPNSGLLMYNCPKEKDPNNPDGPFDERGFKERTGAEVFALVVGAAIGNANPKCSYGQLKNFRRVSQSVEKASASGELVANKTDLDIIKNSINGNQSWPNNDEIFGILEQIMNRLDGATNINENPSSDNPGQDSQ